MNIVFLDASTLGNDVSLDPIAALGNLTCYSNTDNGQQVERIGNAPVVITNKVKIDAEIMDACPPLQLICVAGTGTDNIDKEYAAKKNIIVKNVAGYSTQSVAQTTFALLLEIYNHTSYFNQYVHNGDYSRNGLYTCTSHPFVELYGKRMGIIGMGNIGKQVAQIALAFGMEVCYYSTSGHNNSATQSFKRVELAEMLSTCDVISIHAPKNEQTTNLIAAKELSMMKPTAVLLNTGRGGIVNETDLAYALDHETIAAAGIDVFAKEPFAFDHPFLNMKHPEKLILTPHIAWSSREARIRLIQSIATNIQTSTIHE